MQIDPTVINDISNPSEIFEAVEQCNEELSETSPIADRIILGKLNHNAGRCAESFAAWDQAVRFYRAGLEAISALPSREVRELDIMLTKCLIFTLGLSGQTDEAVELCDALLKDPVNRPEKDILLWLRATINHAKS